MSALEEIFKIIEEGHHGASLLIGQMEGLDPEDISGRMTFMLGINLSLRHPEYARALQAEFAEPLTMVQYILADLIVAAAPIEGES